MEIRDYLGKLCKDKVTGFQGVCTAIGIHLYGCDTVNLVAMVDKKTNKKDETGNGWYDVGRIEILKTIVTPEEVAAPKLQNGKVKGGGETLPVLG